MQQRRLGRLGHNSSFLIYGAAALGAVDQDTADAAIQEALDAGINHFDTAASYGDAELRMGPSIPAIRDRIFLASKTDKRDADESWRQINTSLERLRTDRLDLIQVHAVTDLGELDKVTGKGGSLESVVRAKEEGLVSAIGITGHGHESPATHLEALRRYPFDSVLTPWNYVLSQRPAYAEAFEALSEEIVKQDVGLMTIKSAARKPWPDEARPYSTWYQPWDDQERINAAVAFVVSYEQITGIPTPGEVKLLRLMVEAEKAAASMTREQAVEVLRNAPDYATIFDTAS